MSRLADDDDVTVRFLAREESSLDGTVRRRIHLWGWRDASPRTGQDRSPEIDEIEITRRRECAILLSRRSDLSYVIFSANASTRRRIANTHVDIARVYVAASDAVAIFACLPLASFVIIISSIFEFNK